MTKRVYYQTTLTAAIDSQVGPTRQRTNTNIMLAIWIYYAKLIEVALCVLLSFGKSGPNDQKIPT
jgi:hypothetical protein